MNESFLNTVKGLFISNFKNSKTASSTWKVPWRRFSRLDRRLWFFRRYYSDSRSFQIQIRRPRFYSNISSQINQGFTDTVENFGKAQIDGSWGKNLMLKKNHYQARNEIQTYPTFKILKSVQMSWNPLSWRCSNENRENFFEYCFSSYRALDTVVENFKYFKVYAAPQILDLNVSKSVYDFLHLLACIFTTTMKHESSIVQIGPNYFAFFHLILI